MSTSIILQQTPRLFGISLMCDLFWNTLCTLAVLPVQGSTVSGTCFSMIKRIVWQRYLKEVWKQQKMWKWACDCNAEVKKNFFFFKRFVPLIGKSCSSIRECTSQESMWLQWSSGVACKVSELIHNNLVEKVIKILDCLLKEYVGSTCDPFLTL